MSGDTPTRAHDESGQRARASRHRHTLLLVRQLALLDHELIEAQLHLGSLNHLLLDGALWGKGGKGGEPAHPRKGPVTSVRPLTASQLSKWRKRTAHMHEVIPP